MKRIFTLTILVILLSSKFIQCQISFTDEYILTDYGSIEGYNSHIPFYSADFNDDDFSDVIIHKSNRLFYRSNNQGNSLDQEELIYENNRMIISISEFVDLNEDGKLDFVMTSYDSIHLMLGDGVSFKKDQHYYLQGFYHGSPYLFDINNDGSQDIILTSFDKIYVNDNWKNDFNDFKVLSLENNEQINSIELFKTNDNDDLCLILNTYQYNHLFIGNSTDFVLKKSLLGNHQTMWDYGDINMDGYNDLVINPPDDDIYSYVYNISTGNFDEDIITDNEQWKTFHAPSLIDVDNNGSLDLLFMNYGEINHRLNLGNGVFQNAVRFANGPFQGASKNIKIDFNNDGQIDLINGGFGVYNVLVIKPQFEYELLEEFYYASFYDILCGDLDGDEFIDIMGFNINGSIEIIWGDKDANYSEKDRIEIPYGAQHGFLKDVDEDGIKDILFLNGMNFAQSGMYLVRGLGDRKFEEPISWKSINGKSRFVPIDSDADGQDEFLVFNKGGSNISRYFPGDLDFIEIQTNSASQIQTNSSYLVQIDTIDINNDQYPDILTACTQTNKIGILINDKNGGFVESNVSFEGGVYSVASLDYNNDSWDDILALVYKNDNTFLLNVLLNDKQGSVELYTTYTLNGLQIPYNIYKSDLDNDLDIDLIISSHDYTTSLVLENFTENDTLLYRGNHLIPEGRQIQRMFADINGDSLPDIIDAQFGPGEILYKLNNSIVDPGLLQIASIIDTIVHDGATVLLDELNSTGSITILKEGTNISFTPEDGQFYTHNAEFGIGANVDENAYIVYSGSDTVIEVTGLQSNTTYEVAVFEYNSNVPENTIINYGAESVTSTFTTKRAIFSIQNFPDTIKIEEDSILTIELSDYLNDFGKNTYEVVNENSEVSLTLEGSKLIITPNQDYFGMDSLSISATLPTELFQAGFILEIISVNDPPEIEPIEENIVINTDTPGEEEAVTVEYNDPDDSGSQLRIEVFSSNQEVVTDSDIKVEVKEDELVISYTSSDYGISTITVIIIDEHGTETRMSFDLEIAKITGLDASLLKEDLYPNPTTGIVYFKKSIRENGMAILHNLMGEIIMDNINLERGMLDISNVSSGVYILRSEFETYRIIKE